MKLFFSKGACSLVVRIVINELKLPAIYEAVDLKTKKTALGGDFLKINSKGAVPTLVTNKNEILTENAVILQYLADSNHVPELLPAFNDFKRYKVLEWLNYMTTELHKNFGLLFHPETSESVKKEFIIPLLKKKFVWINGQLSHTFLVDSHFTLPDAYLFVMLFWAQQLNIDLSNYSNLMMYYAHLKTRDSIMKSLEEEGIIL